VWNVTTKAIPVVIGATGTVSKSFRKYLNDIPEKHEFKKLQKTSILGTAHTVQNVLIQGDTKKRELLKLLLCTFQNIIVFVKHFYGESTLLTVPLIHDY
jgi:hypothetical protein